MSCIKGLICYLYIRFGRIYLVLVDLILESEGHAVSKVSNLGPENCIMLLNGFSVWESPHTRRTKVVRTATRQVLLSL